MKRYLATIAATLAAAAITIPAVAAPSGDPGDELAAFATCLRSHGIAIPAGLEGAAVKQWVGAHEGEAGVADAIQACDPHPERGKSDDQVAPEALRACLRGKGLDAPESIDRLKPWIFEQSRSSAGKAALTACGFDADPAKKAVEHGPCGGGDTAKAARHLRRSS